MFNFNVLSNFSPEEILIYLRKSRADDPLLSTEEVLSKHEASLDEWAEKNLSAPIPEENRYREIVSGGDSISERPEFQKLLKRIESPSIKAVLVVEISRLGRPDMEEIGRISKYFRYTNTVVITPIRAFNIADEYERDMFEQELKRGNFYLEYTKKILKAGRDISVKNGNYLCSIEPYGYDKVTIVEGKKKCPTLAINEEEANIVRLIFDWYVNENIGTSTIAKRLNDMGVNTPKMSRWSATAIRRRLDDPLYIGKIRWNAKKVVCVVEDGQIRKTRTKNEGDDYILTDGKHEPIISEELFRAAQEKRGRSHKSHRGKELKNPLATILYCECGKAMSFNPRTNMPKANNRLRCNNQTYCKNGTCSLEEIMPFVADILKQKITEFEIEANNGNEGLVEKQEKLIKTFEKKLSDIQSKELLLWESQLDPDPDKRMPSHIFQTMTAKLGKEMAETEEASAKAKEALTAPIDLEKKIVTFQKAYDALLDDKKSVAEKNHLLKACISRITYHRDPIERLVGVGTGRKRTAPPIHLDVKLMV